MIVNMLAAEASTKVPVAIHHAFWQSASDARAQLSQLFGLMFPLIVRVATWSWDFRLAPRSAS